jgi:hypothetical protein
MSENRIKFARSEVRQQQLLHARELCNDVLRRSPTAPILSSAFNAALDIPSMPIFTDTEDFATALRTTVDSLVLQGYKTFKTGSCFADLASVRPQSTTQYNDDYFFREKALIVPVLIPNDIKGAVCETRANSMPMMVNVRKNESKGGGDGPCGFGRKEFVRSSFAESKS